MINLRLPIETCRHANGVGEVMVVEDKTAVIEALSPRQKEILRLISRHLQDKEVARLLKIGEGTVKSHVTEVRRRLGVSSRREAARLLEEYDAQMALSLDGGLPSRGIADHTADLPGSAYEQALTPPERTTLPGPLERSGDRLADAGSPGKDDAYQGRPERVEDASPERGGGKSDFYDYRGDRVLDGRSPSILGNLRRLSLIRWFGLAALTGIGGAFVVAGAAAAVMGVIYFFQFYFHHGQ